MENFRKMLDESNVDNEGRATQKPHSDRSQQKRTQEFVREIHDNIDNSGQSMKSIVKYMAVFGFLNVQLAHEGIRCFSYKRQFLLQAMEDKFGIPLKNTKKQSKPGWEIRLGTQIKKLRKQAWMIKKKREALK